MVSGRRNIMGDNQGKATGYKDDIEAQGRPGLSRFRSAIHSVIEDGRRERMKQQLLHELDTDGFEKFRSTDKQLKDMRKELRKYYQGVNEQLNDWIEVDTLVRHLADDVLESFDPHDEDEDGIVETHGVLLTKGDIEPFLPQEERERRVRARKYATWAINVRYNLCLYNRLTVQINVIANVLLLAAKIVAAMFSSSLSLIASLVDSALDLLCTIIIWSTSKLVQYKILALSKRFPVGRPSIIYAS